MINEHTTLGALAVLLADRRWEIGSLAGKRGQYQAQIVNLGGFELGRGSGATPGQALAEALRMAEARVHHH